MVAKRVTVLSRSFAPEETGWRLDERGHGRLRGLPPPPICRAAQKSPWNYKDDAKEFAQENNIERIIERYSRFCARSDRIKAAARLQHRSSHLGAETKTRSRKRNTTRFYTFVSHAAMISRYSACISPPTPRWRSRRCSLCPSGTLTAYSAWDGLNPRVNLYCRKIHKSRPRPRDCSRNGCAFSKT